MSTNDTLSLVSLGAAVAGWLTYLSLIPREKVPEKPHVFSAWMGASCLLSAASFRGYFDPSARLSIPFSLASGLTLMLGAFFFFLLAQAPMPDGEIRCTVGGQLPPFEARDADDRPFSSASLSGGPVLLKFFRGHW